MPVPVVVVTQGGVPVTFVDPSGAAAVLGLTVGTTPISGGTTGRALYDNAGVVGERAAIVILGSGVGGSVSSGTAEVALATVTVPAGAMGTTGRLRVTCLWSYTNSGNNKVLRVRFSGTAGTIYNTLTATTSVQVQTQAIISNNNATGSQVGYNAGNANPFGGVTANALVTSSVDTTASTTISISGQPASGGETITLVNYTVELIPGV